MGKIPALYVTQATGNSVKPLLVATRRALTCNITCIDVLAGAGSAPEFVNINPLCVVPFMVLNDGKGLGESNAIARYLPDSPWSTAQAA